MDWNMSRNTPARVWSPDTQEIAGRATGRVGGGISDLNVKGRIRHPEDNAEDYLHDLGGMQRFLKQGRKRTASKHTSRN